MRKGFTLIELLAVITILALIILIAVPIVIRVIEDSKETTQKDNVELYGRAVDRAIINYYVRHPEANEEPDITTMENEGLINYKGEPVKCDTAQIANRKVYLANCKVGDEKVDAEYGEIGDTPYLANGYGRGLTPVAYIDNKWKVVANTNENKEWYDYDEQKWANAVVLRSDVKKQVGDTVTVEGDNPEALMMLVWIPRFEYKIEGTYGKGGTNANLPGEIEVNLIDKNKTKATEGYILHPAFTFGEEELSGIWVGKFELSSKSDNTTSNDNLGCNQYRCTSDISNLRILPNVSSLRYNKISNFFYAIRGIESDNTFGLSNIDTHVMKNSEWGAVAYLSQSKYGKYGNFDYENKYKEVYQNKSATYITGSSNGTPPQSQVRTGGQCAYNNNTDLGVDESGYKMGQCGTGASTTGNIYGVYDMSGGAVEYVMGVYGDSQGIYSGYSRAYHSGFKGRTGDDNQTVEGATVPDSKYYDLYKTDDEETACGKVCYGHALSETSGWYGDNKMMIDETEPWFVRGGYFSENDVPIGAGVFAFKYGDGDNDDGISARFVGIAK